MSERHFKLLANYNRVTNELMNTIIKEITEEEWNREFNGFFKSIHELCSHIYIGDFNWLKRFKNLRAFNALNKSIFEKEYKFTETIFENIAESVVMRKELDDIIIEYINELEKDDLEKILQFKDSKGSNIERKMEPLILHMFNHQTHHRGMISLYLELLGKENSFSDSLYRMEL